MKNLEVIGYALLPITVMIAVIYGIYRFGRIEEPPFERNYVKWEFSAFRPATATVDELLGIECSLKSNGYTRVVMIPKYNETWTTVERTGTEIFATRQLPSLLITTNKKESSNENPSH